MAKKEERFEVIFRDAILDNMNYQDILGDFLQDVTE